MFGARGVSSVTLGSLPPVLLALALGRRVSRKSACKDRSSLGSISRFGSAHQLDLVYDRDSLAPPRLRWSSWRHGKLVRTNGWQSITNGLNRCDLHGHYPLYLEFFCAILVMT